VYVNTSPLDPAQAAGVIIGPPPDGAPGGIAIIAAAMVRKTSRFIVATARGPSPARLAPPRNDGGG
jgi:hypothetical protein